MGITRSSVHKRRATGGKQAPWRKKKKFEMGRPPANTKLSTHTDVRVVRCRGGNSKFRALRLDHGNFSWGSEAISRKTRIVDVVYNATHQELVRTKTLVKNAVVQVDASPFKQWYAQHYGVDLGKKAVDEVGKTTGERQDETAEKKESKSVQSKLKKRNQQRKLEENLEEQFMAGRLYACISSRPGQCGRADGYILEGRELEFYVKKMQKRKGKSGAS
jgi:small subunit ribosomal protein S8e